MGKPSKRDYDNRLRATRAEETRRQILEAIAEELSDGSITELSVARVAKRAGVSEPTVYRHFPNREAMFDALDAHVNQKLAVPELPEEIDDLAPFVERLFAAFDAERELVRGLMVARLGVEWATHQRARRIARLQPVLDRLVDGLPASEARAATAVIRYLQSSRAWKAFADDFGMDGREAGAACAWATQALLTEIERMKAGAGEPRRSAKKKTATTRKGARK